MSTLGGGDFELVVRQQPKYACVAIGKGKERKPIDPPPIVQLLVNPRKDPARTFLQNPYLILTARLIRKGDEDQDEQAGPKENDLTGTLVSSLYSLKDTDNSQGGFFVFGDLSVRRVGTYRLAFILYELKLAEKECWLLSRTVSDPFVVYATKTFPGLAESTFLTRSFSDQGVRLRLRKDSRTVSTKKRTIGQADPMRASSQGMHQHGYLAHDGSHHHHHHHQQQQDLTLSPTGHSPHPLRRLSSLHDPVGMGGGGGGPLDRSRGSLSSQATSYYADSPQLRSAAGDYTATTGGSSYGYATTTATPYDVDHHHHKPPHKRARMSMDGGPGTSPDDDDSPHPHPGSGYEAETTSYGHGHHPYSSHSHAAGGPRTVPASLTSLYPVTTATTSTTSTPTAIPTGYVSGGVGGGGLPAMASPFASMHHPHHHQQQHMSLPRLDTSTISHHHPHNNHNHNHTSQQQQRQQQHLPHHHSPATAVSASTPTTTSTTTTPHSALHTTTAAAAAAAAAAHHAAAAAMFASGGGPGLPYHHHHHHPAAAVQSLHQQQLNGLGIVNALPGLELDGVGVGVGHGRH
ncbi:velvet factor-domain-containing protein [Chaetomium strumarium]|uniref:Velvet factor-domain-containing protein n=1 Tax=Chaetomium strumarium TaxID=1170767 RepID=A0AAJ0LZH4_9PEZI|nr:velvet factor-domain-containing protein [Chaetomium strumarium]